MILNCDISCILHLILAQYKRIFFNLLMNIKKNKETTLVYSQTFYKSKQVS